MANVTLYPTADVTLSLADADTNKEAGRIIQCGFTVYKYNSLLKFGGLSSVTGAVGAATLKLYYESGTLADQVVDIYRLRRSDWSVTQATWNSYKTGSSWGTAGGSNTATDIYSSKMATSVTLSSSDITITLDAAEVEAMRQENNGINIVSLTGYPSGDRAYYDVDNGEALGKSPELTVTFSG